jgi:hypothetical protein
MANKQVFRNDRLSEQWSNGAQPGDPTAGYVMWDAQGHVITQRALTAAESAQFAADDAAQTAQANEAATSTKLAAALDRLTQIINQGNSLNAQGTLMTVNQQKALGAAVADLAQAIRWDIRKTLALRDAID